MKRLNSTDLNNLLTGTIFYGTGGGGSPSLAQAIYKRISLRNQLPSLVQITEFSNNDLFMTAFPVGGLKPQEVPERYLRLALTSFQQRCRMPIAGIIPVEIGPLSVAVAAKLAAELKLPLIDADFVGGRSTPEVFLETITLFDIPRTPLAVINASGDCAVLEKSSSAVFEENFLRSFANKSSGFAYVFGYPTTAKVVQKALTLGTVAQAMKTGYLVNSKRLVKNINTINGEVMFSGAITSIRSQKQSGFTSKYIEIKKNRRQNYMLKMKIWFCGLMANRR